MNRTLRAVSLLAVPATVLALTACGGPPPREDVEAGVVQIVLEGPVEVTEAQAEEIATCIVDEMYDTASDATLQAWADGSDETDVADGPAMTETSIECSQKVFGG